jgi:hypothetical protein
MLRGATPNQNVAFHYTGAFSPDEIQWYRRFSILVTGAILGNALSDELRKGGSKLVSNEWSSAFYPGDSASAAPAWQTLVLQNRRTWLLNAEAVGGGAADGQRTAFWYDFGSPELITARARHLAAQLEASGYAGYFFDTLGFAHLPGDLRKEFQRRHARTDYETAQGQLLKELRALAPGKLIFSNQGYRNPAAYLPYADLDASESSFTYLDSEGSTVLRPFWKADAPWESVSVPMTQLIAPAARQYPNVRFVHVNYAAGNPASISRAVRYSLACAKLWGHESYLMSADLPSEERNEIYFSDLGQPLGEGFEQDRSRGIAWRKFQNGVVAINSGVGAATIPSLNLELPEAPRGYILRN